MPENFLTYALVTLVNCVLWRKKLYRYSFVVGFIGLSALLIFLVYIDAGEKLHVSYLKDFHNAHGIGSLLYVHAALWTGDGVRISVLKPRGTNETIKCHLWYSSNQISNATVVQAVVKDMDSYNSDITVAYIKCPVNNINRERVAPISVSLANEGPFSAGAVLQLFVENRNMDPYLIHKEKNKGAVKSNHSEPKKNRIVEFTVCIPAMFNFNDAAKVVEKLEMVRFLGAGRVVFYNHSIASNVNSVLQFYIREWAAGNESLEVVVHSWKLPPIQMHYHGQIAAIDDCLYRYGWLSQYMVFNDLDEFMIPLRHGNWSSLIAEREKLNPGHAAFMFRASVMNKDHSSPAKGFQDDAFRYGSSILGFTQRDKYIYSPYDKSKMIVNPRKVDSLGVHYVQDDAAPTDVIPVDDGILYHYRWPLRPCDPEVKENRVVSKFGKRLLVRLKAVWRKLEGVTLKEKPKSLNSRRITCYP